MITGFQQIISNFNGMVSLEKDKIKVSHTSNFQETLHLWSGTNLQELIIYECSAFRQISFWSHWVTWGACLWQETLVSLSWLEEMCIRWISFSTLKSQLKEFTKWEFVKVNPQKSSICYLLLQTIYLHTIFSRLLRIIANIVTCYLWFHKWVTNMFLFHFRAQYSYAWFRDIKDWRFISINYIGIAMHALLFWINWILVHASLNMPSNISVLVVDFLFIFILTKKADN